VSGRVIASGTGSRVARCREMAARKGVYSIVAVLMESSFGNDFAR